MTEVFQCRVDRKLAAKAKAVAKEIGTTPGEVVRLMFAQMVKRRAIPFPLQAVLKFAAACLLASRSVVRRAQLWEEL